MSCFRDVMDFSGLKGVLIPQDKLFFTMLEKQAKTVLKGGEALLDMLKKYNSVALKARKIKGIEHEGDDIVHDIYLKLNTTFITPIDHTDISALATIMDDILDRINGTSNRLFLYGVQTPPKDLKGLAEVLLKQVKELDKAIAGLRNSRDRSDILKICIVIHTLENEADDLYYGAVARLFKTNDAIEIIKLKEIYDSIERATDMCEGAANILKDIVMKHS